VGFLCNSREIGSLERSKLSFGGHIVGVSQKRHGAVRLLDAKTVIRGIWLSGIRAGWPLELDSRHWRNATAGAPHFYRGKPELRIGTMSRRGMHGESRAPVRDNFDWRDLRGLGKLLGSMCFGSQSQARSVA
jgi:hypothetical protein